MKSFLILIIISFSYNTYASSGCSLTFAKKISKSIFELEADNNKSDGEISFKIGSKKWGLKTLEYTKDHLVNKINDSLTGDSTKEKLNGHLKTLNSDDRLRMYKVSQQRKVGAGKCGLSATCTSSVMLVTAIQLDDNRCFVKQVNEAD